MPKHLKRIEKLVGSPAFDSLLWTGGDLAPLSLIYGWNGSGKTTISRLLRAIGRQDPELASGPEDFSIRSTAGLIRKSEVSSKTLPLYVFNEDFVRENVQFDGARAKPIVVLGSEGQAAQQRVENLEKQLNAATARQDEMKSNGEVANLPDRILTEAASAVPKEFASTPLAFKYEGRTYKRPQVEALLESGAITPENVSSHVIDGIQELQSLRAVISERRSKAPGRISELPSFRTTWEAGVEVLKIRPSLASKNPKFAQDPVLGEWVEQGLTIHSDRHAHRCLFCDVGEITPDFIENLAEVFSDGLVSIRQKASDIAGQLEPHIGSSGSVAPDSSFLYPDAVEEFATESKKLLSGLETLRKRIEPLHNSLRTRERKLFEDVPAELPAFPSKEFDAVNESVRHLNELSDAHDSRVEKRAEEVEVAAQKLELHRIAEILVSKDYFRHVREKELYLKSVSELSAEIGQLRNDLATARAQAKDFALAVVGVNEVLRQYFGDRYIYLELSGDGTEYVLKRRGRDATSLSDGEKSILALVYFLVKLTERGRRPEDVVVVLDDPVDSQDSRFLFQTMGLIRSRLEACGQLVVLTHNFEFFNLVRDWYAYSGRAAGEKAFLMIEGHHDSSVCQTTISNLSPLLKNHKSEYHFLFACLVGYVEGWRVMEDPLAPNVARKVLDYFSGFKWALKARVKLRDQLDRFVADADPVRKAVGEAMKKFLDELSHGQDFSRPITASSMEAKPMAEKVLKFIELADKEHFDEMLEQSRELGGAGLTSGAVRSRSSAGQADHPALQSSSPSVS